MEEALYQDLMDTLEGIDPLDYIASDPDLNNIAQEFLGRFDGGTLKSSYFASEDTSSVGSLSPSSSTSSCGSDSESSLSVFATADKNGCTVYQGPTKFLGHINGNLEGRYMKLDFQSLSPSPTVASIGGTSDSNNSSSVINDKNACAVCKGQTKGRKFYGIPACNSCRAFFGRAVKDDNYETFDCETGLFKCPVEPKSWMSCKRCRFDKCIREGMKLPKPGKNKAETPSIQKTNCTEVQVSKQDLQKTMQINDLITGLRRLMSPTTMSPCEKNTLETLAPIYVEVNGKIFLNVMQKDQDALRSFMEMIFHGGRYKLYLDKGFDNYLKYCHTEAYLKLGPSLSRDIKEADRIKLAHGNMPLIADYLIASRVGNRINFKQEMFDHVKILDSETNAYKMYSKITKNGSLSPVPVAYENVYDHGQLGMKDPESIKNHKKTVLRLTHATERGFDPVICALTACIILHTPDFLDLENPRAAENIQAVFASILFRYLRTKGYPDANAIFRNSMMASSYARELREARDKAFKMLKL